jgi:hypothetical protein
MGQYYVASLTIWLRLAGVVWSLSCTDLRLNVPHGNGVLLWFEVDDFDAANCYGDEGEHVHARYRTRPAGHTRTLGEAATRAAEDCSGHGLRFRSGILLASLSRRS